MHLWFNIALEYIQNAKVTKAQVAPRRVHTRTLNATGKRARLDKCGCLFDIPKKIHTTHNEFLYPRGAEFLSYGSCSGFLLPFESMQRRLSCSHYTSDLSTIDLYIIPVT